MASSSEAPRTYHVFMSFRGPDVRKSFASHLYSALDQRGIYTYIDNKELRKGECISPALMKAINESRIAIVIFSENYAESRWCLEELGEIMERYKQSDLIVLPVFYKVEPREVRGRRNSYGDAMAKHECKIGKDSEKLKKWKEALDNAGSLSGWDLNNYGDEAKLIEDITKQISIQLNQRPLHVTEYPVGLDSRVKKLTSMLSRDDVCMVGLWGPGGIGKTIMAKATYNAIFKKFVGSSFIAHVREKADDLVSLQKQLLSEILPDKTLTIFSVDGGIELMKERLHCKKILLVLDDVDRLDQLNKLVGACAWFGKGSKIIVTTRDKHLLTSHGIDHILEVERLKDEEERELFCLHCFQRSQSIQISEDSIQKALHYANGLPLALEVLGSFLRGRNEIEWKSALTKLANSPEQTINQVLKISFDTLEHNEKEIFLDIACFFKGCDTKYVKEVLDSCGFQTTIGIQVLIERALVSLERGAIQMHDLVQLMGRDIVNQKYPDDPNKRSRLWRYEDVLDVFSRDMETNAIKAIKLALPSYEEISLSPDAFANMKKLRLLMLRNVHVSFQAPLCLPNEIRWLEWPEYSGPTLKFNSGLNKLVGLNVSSSCIKGLEETVQPLKKLKFLYCRGCVLLVNIPNLSIIPNLETLDFSGCENLVRIHQSVAFLNKLKILSLHGTAIEEVPPSIENAISLEKIYLNACMNLTTLPSSMYNLNRLEVLSLENCSNFIQFPKKMDDSADPHGSLGFEALEYLDLSYCNLSEVEFLDNRFCFTALSSLDLTGNNISSLPTSINRRNRLKHLHVGDSNRLCEIPELPSSILGVAADSCKSLCRVSKLPIPRGGFLTASFTSCSQKFSISDIFPREGISDQTGEVNIFISGDEMPSWMVPVDGDRIGFSNPHLSPSKCVGLALCAVLSFENEDSHLNFKVFNTRDKDIWWTAMPLLDRGLFPRGTNCVQFIFSPCSEVFPEGVDEADREYRVEIEPWSGVIVKKWGWGIIWKDGGDDPNAVVQHNG